MIYLILYIDIDNSCIVNFIKGKEYQLYRVTVAC